MSRIVFYFMLVIGFSPNDSICAQQFAGDNQWVAPHGVATLVAIAGQEYSQIYLVVAVLPEWEFNAQFVFYYDDPGTNSES